MPCPPKTAGQKMPLFLLTTDYNLSIEPLWLLTNCMPGAEMTWWLASVLDTVATSARPALKLYLVLGRRCNYRWHSRQKKGGFYGTEL
jgi:hypothetical protein